MLNPNLLRTFAPMDKTIIQRRRELLEETVTHYTLSNRNSLNGKCYYYPVNPNTEGCAIGRKIADKELCKQMDAMKETAVSDTQIFNLLPIELQELGIAFLTELQRLHDLNSYWCKTGLSEQGIEAKNHIIKHYCI